MSTSSLNALAIVLLLLTALGIHVIAYAAIASVFGGNHTPANIAVAVEVAVFAAACVTSGMAIARWRSERREKHQDRLERRNRCMYCGYSLNGLVSSKCPECGRERRPSKAAESGH